jgi:hypothetical protein
MSPSIERNPSEFFTVVGSAYVPEGHGDRFDHLAALPESEQLKLGVTSLWLSFFAMLSDSLFNGGQPVRPTLH